MAACMESQADILECTASAQSGRREVTVCFSPMSMVSSKLTRTLICKQLVSVHELHDVYSEHLHFPNILMRQERNLADEGLR